MRSFWLWLFVIPTAIVSACGGDAFTAATAVDAGVDGPFGDDVAPDADIADGCVPKTCADLHWACGKGDDGCGKALDCGACHVANFECGVTVAHACSCKPKTCADLNYNCGEATDGCGGALHCGTCPTLQSCGGGGTDHQCGVGVCLPKKCTDVGATCGSPSDGCGSTLACGTCTGQSICDPTYKCKCIPSTCGQLGWQCGTGPDGCGGTLDCGSTCSTGHACVGNQCVSQTCMPQTSCAQKGYTCGVLYNGCANETCGSGPPSRNMIGDTACFNHQGKPYFYQCVCNTATSLHVDSGTRNGGGVDSGPPPLDSGVGGIDSGFPDSGGGADSGTMSCGGEGAPNPPVPGWNCDIVTSGSSNTGLTFCCAQ